MSFINQKKDRFQRVDLSRKGSVDEAIKDVVSLINSLPMYFTTSSCAGRTVVVENLENKVQKSGCKWLHVSHDPLSETDIENTLKGDLKGEAVFKFEPMVMHIQCETLEDAQRMHQAAVAAGFRNSGITVGKKGKIVMAVRSTHSLEAPLSHEGRILVSHEYMKYLAVSANSKMEENFARIHRFHENLMLFTKEASCPSSVKVENKKTGKVKNTEVKHHDDNPKTSLRNAAVNSDDYFELSMFADSCLET